MGTIITIVLVVVVVLAVLGLGPRVFWDGITTGFDRAKEMAGPIAANITQEAQELAAEESTDAVKRVITN